MTAMHDLISNATFDASSCTYRYRAHSFLPLTTRLITTLKIPMETQWGCIRSCGSHGEARKKREDWEGEKWRATWEPIDCIGKEADFWKTKGGKKKCFEKRRGGQVSKGFSAWEKNGIFRKKNRAWEGYEEARKYSNWRCERVVQKEKGIWEERSCRKKELGRKTKEMSQEGNNIGMISISY